MLKACSCKPMILKGFSFSLLLTTKKSNFFVINLCAYKSLLILIFFIIANKTTKNVIKVVAIEPQLRKCRDADNGH